VSGVLNSSGTCTEVDQKVNSDGSLTITGVISGLTLQWGGVDGISLPVTATFVVTIPAADVSYYNSNTPVHTNLFGFEYSEWGGTYTVTLDGLDISSS
jgi:hypothetical protein